MNKEALRGYWKKHKWKTCLIPVIIIILIWGRSTIEIITHKMETEKTAKVEVQTERDTWKTKSNKFKDDLKRVKTSEQVPFYHPTTGEFLGLRWVKKDQIDNTRTGTSELEVQIRELEKRIEMAFEKGKVEGRKETRPAAKSLNLGFGADAKGRWLAGGGIDAELFGIQASVTALAVVPAAPLNWKAYGGQLLLLIHR